MTTLLYMYGNCACQRQRTSAPDNVCRPINTAIHEVKLVDVVTHHRILDGSLKCLSLPTAVPGRQSRTRSTAETSPQWMLSKQDMHSDLRKTTLDLPRFSHSLLPFRNGYIFGIPRHVGGGVGCRGGVGVGGWGKGSAAGRT